MNSSLWIIFGIYSLTHFSACIGQSNEAGPVNFSNELLASAENGDAQSQFRVSQCYYLAKGIDQNPKEAVRWLKKSADQGNLNALTVLFGLLMKGDQGIQRDPKEGIKYLQKIANSETSDPETQKAINGFRAVLAQFYLEGGGVNKNVKEALKWAEISAESGDSMGLALLGNIYLNGNGVKKDPTKAYGLYRKSATKGDKLGMTGEANCLFQGIGVQQDYLLAFKKLKTISDSYKGQTSVEALLGICYLKGLGTQSDLDKAEHYFLLAANDGSEEAKAFLIDVEQLKKSKTKEKLIGKYRVEGQNEDNSRYVGEIEIAPHENRLKAVWKIEKNKESEIQMFEGEGFILGNYLCIYFSGPSRGAVLYEIKPDAKILSGTWIGEDLKVSGRYVGTEKLVKK